MQIEAKDGLFEAELRGDVGEKVFLKLRSTEVSYECVKAPIGLRCNREGEEALKDSYHEGQWRQN